MVVLVQPSKYPITQSSNQLTDVMWGKCDV